MRQNTLITCILTLAVLLSVLCLCWHFTFPVVVTYHKNCQSQLFPGCDQYQWFSEMLSDLIQDHEAEVSELGVNPKMIVHTQSERELLPTCHPFLVVHQFHQYVFMQGGPWGL